MTETESPGQSLFERTRAPLAFVMVAVCALGVLYFVFWERKTDAYMHRDARLIARVAQQIQRSLRVTGRFSDAVTWDEKLLLSAYKFDSTIPAEQRLPSQIFDDITVDDCPENGAEGNYLERKNGRVTLNFVLTKPTDAVTHLKSRINLDRLMQPIVRQSVEGVFDAFFIFDGSGDVLYQKRHSDTDDTAPDIRIVQLQELTTAAPFEKPQTVPVSALATTSRQMPVHLADNDFVLFSVPLGSNIRGSKEPAGASRAAATAAAVPPDTWIVCGLVSRSRFRANSLAISETMLCALIAVVLLALLSWPFAKLALMGRHQKVSLMDVILLGMCSIFIAAIVSLIALDVLTYRHLEAIGDQQLSDLARSVAANFQDEITTAAGQLDEAEPWAERQVAEGQLGSHADLLADKSFPLRGFPRFHSFGLIDRKGVQRSKWSVDHVPLPLLNMAWRPYFSAAFGEGRDSILLDGRRLTIASIEAITTGEPDLILARKTQIKDLPVIAMSLPTAPSVFGPVVPEGLSFAIIDANGRVMLHSDSSRNTVENLFAESNFNASLQSIVAAHQRETVDISYAGQDYRAFVRPLKWAPWTLVTLRDRHPLRAMNAEALMTAMFFLTVFNVAGLLSFICVIVLVRPRYRAPWLWPDAGNVRNYGELAVVYMVLLFVAAALTTLLPNGQLLVLPFWFVPLVLGVTYLYIRHSEEKAKRAIVTASAAVMAAFILMFVWRGTSWNLGFEVSAKLITSMLLVTVVVRAMFRSRRLPGQNSRRERQTALPVAYLLPATLLLLLTGAVPAVVFFKATYKIELTSYVKSVQMKLADDLQERWWRIATEFRKARGMGKESFLDARWLHTGDLYSSAAFGTNVVFTENGRNLPPPPSSNPSQSDVVMALPRWVERILPRYSATSLNTRDLVRDRSDDDLLIWPRNGHDLTLEVRTPGPVRSFTIHSTVPSVLPLAALPARVAAGFAAAVLIVLAVVLTIARFIAKRVFLLDLVSPLWLPGGFPGFRRLICYPCDDGSVRRFAASPGFRRLDLHDPSDVEALRNVPQSFPDFAPTVFIDHLDYSFATGENAEILRAALDRLMRNPDRIVIVRPITMTVVSQGLLQREEADVWSKVLSSFVWVNISQIEMGADSRVQPSGAWQAMNSADVPTSGRTERKPWWAVYLRRIDSALGFDSYAAHLMEAPLVVARTIHEEVRADPYLETLVSGLEKTATGRDQVLDEIGERAEEYYTALWETCSASEKLVLMQIAETGLVNPKMRRDVRRMLARGLLHRDPQLRVMNETFRRFVVGIVDTPACAKLQDELDAHTAADAWKRVRVPFFAAVVVALLFFFATQRDLFDSTFAVITTLTASIPALLRMVTGFGDRAAAKTGS